jgi:hypothetical protein
MSIYKAFLVGTGQGVDGALTWKDDGWVVSTWVLIGYFV